MTHRYRDRHGLVISCSRSKQEANNDSSDMHHQILARTREPRLRDTDASHFHHGRDRKLEC